MEHAVRESISRSHLIIDSDTFINCSDVESFARTTSSTIELSEYTLEHLQRSTERLDALRKSETPIYGVTTGFGPFVAFSSADEGGIKHGEGLIAHLTAGSGDIAPADAVRATMLIRVHTLAKGYSAIPGSTLNRYIDLLHHNIVPAVPEIGSVGASGDLTPLAHIARVLAGIGYVTDGETIIPAPKALADVGLSPHPLEGREALALVNGTAFMSAYAALAITRAYRLLQYAEALTGWMYRLLGCRAQALDPQLHAVRKHTEQMHSAARIRAEASRYGDWEDTSRPLQEVYSFRCAPQILGACRDNLRYAQRVVETEINGVTDNPVFVEAPDQPEGATVLHGGNFQGQQVSFASDALNAALTQVGVLVERQIAALVNPALNDGAPLLLAWTPGACSGLAGGQMTATALVAEMRHRAHPCAISSIPTNGLNQDIVSMGTMAAREAYSQSNRLSSILAVAGIACAQLNALREAGRAPGQTTPQPDWMPLIDPIEEDRGLWEEIEAIASQWLYKDLNE